MTKQTIAVFHSQPDHENAVALLEALSRSGLAPVACPHGAARLALAWALQLTAETCSAVVIRHDAPATVAALLPACPEGIPVFVWCPTPQDISALAPIMTAPAVLVSAAPTAEAFAHTISCLKIMPPTDFVLDRADPSATPVSSPASAPASVPPTTIAPEDSDDAAYRELEALMATRAKAPPSRHEEPTPPQVGLLDFTMELRNLMAHGKDLAAKGHHQELLALHYLAALGPPYSDALGAAGLTTSIINHALQAVPQESRETDPLVNDEIFSAISTAKDHSRTHQQGSVRTVDFLYALFAQTEGSVTDLLREAGLSQDQMFAALRPLYAIDENPPAPFFAPSSLDQAGFAEFDPEQVQAISERLKKLPAFQKAAAPVKESPKHSKTGDGAPVAPTAPTVTLNDISPPPKPELIQLSPSFPDVADVEYLADRLLEGHVVGFPSDIMYALAADASNPYAIQRLREASGKPADQPLGLLLHSTSQLKHLVQTDPDLLESLLDDHWPGPLTLVFRAAGTLARHVSPTQTVALRQPADDISLAILSMIGRPLAVTSWNDIEPGAVVDIHSLADRLAGEVSILAYNQTPIRPVTTTVLNVTEPGWPIVRQGAVSQEALEPYRTRD